MSKKLLISLLTATAFAVLPAMAQASATSPHYYSTNGNGNPIAEGKPVPVVAFGTLSLKNTAGGTGASVTCHNVVGGFAENPKGTSPETKKSGPGGIGETQAFDPYECTSEACKAGTGGSGPDTYISVLAEPVPFATEAPGGTATNLAWKSFLKVDTTAKRAETTIRSVTKYAQVNVLCHINTGFTGAGEAEFGETISEVSEGSNQPWTGTNVAAISPTYNFTEFDNKASPEEPNNGEGSGELHGPPPSETGRLGKTEGKLQVVPYTAPGVLNVKVG